MGIVFGLPATHARGERGGGRGKRLLKFVNLAGKGDFLAKNLPYGDQRRLEIGRALAARPKLLLLDEPTAGMNPRETQDVMDFIRHLRDELGITIILIEHQMRVVMGISETVTVLDYGREDRRRNPCRNSERSEGHRSLLGTREAPLNIESHRA